MRQKPDRWKNATRIQWGCVLMQLLGESHLQRLHLVLSGLRSVELSRQVAPYQNAVRTARVILGEALTLRAVQTAVRNFNSASPDVRSFDIDSETLEFQARSAYDPDIAEASKTLMDGLSTQPRSRDFADTSKHLVAHPTREQSLPFRLHGLKFPKPKTHDLERVPDRPITICWSDLETLATELDDRDRKAGKESQNWVGRLSEIEARMKTEIGWQETKSLPLDGLKHLIGLPGAGKTTLIVLLCILLARCGRRVAVFVTAIPIARSYLETIRGYGTDAGLLMGRATSTHMKHANTLAELVAVKQGNGGFARTLEGADLFAQSCPLPAFADQWPDNEVWSFGNAPCGSIREVGSTYNKLCPAWSCCGRVRNQRQLVNHPVWLGHIRSADTTLPAHTAEENLRYFELIARTFDLVIIDEADEAQKYLDEYGTQVLTLTGNEASVHEALLQTQSVLAANRQPVHRGLLRYMLCANEFQGFALSLVEEIRNFQRDNPDLTNRYEDQFLTVGFLLRNVCNIVEYQKPESSDFLSALIDLWQTAMYAAFYQRGADGSWSRLEQHRVALAQSKKDCQGIWLQLNRMFRQYLSEDPMLAMNRCLPHIVSTLQKLLKAPNTEIITPLVKLLVVVGFTIASYQRLAKYARYLTLHGTLTDANHSLGLSDLSPEIRETVPRSILGTYSAVRFRRVPETEGLEIDHLVMDCTPRMLLHRLHEIGSTNVLLTSATSYLEQSSQYHVGKSPDFLLSSRNPQMGVVHMYFQPKLDRVTKSPLRFSGGGSDRERNLRSMVEELATPGPLGNCDLDRTIKATLTSSGSERKAALVVNSYVQVRLVVDAILKVNPSLGVKTRGVLRELPTDHAKANFVIRSRVEELGPDPTVEVLVFPLSAIGRAMNIVFTNDKDRGKAAIGSIFFLTRPHPAAGDLGLMQSIVARETEKLDAEDMQQLNLDEVEVIIKQRRYLTFRAIARLLARPMAFSQLGNDMRMAFAANLLVSILQMVGRGIRRQMPVEVYFVDAAWAPNSAEGRPDSARSSTLVAMQRVLDLCLRTSDPHERETYQELYGPFADALREIDGVIYPEAFSIEDVDDFDPSPAELED